MKYNHILILFIGLALLVGCKKNIGSHEIELPNEINQEDLNTMLSMIPEAEALLLSSVRYYSFKSPKQIEKVVEVIDIKTREKSLVIQSEPEWHGKYGVELSIGVEKCKETIIYIFLKEENSWKLESKLTEFPAIDCVD